MKLIRPDELRNDTYLMFVSSLSNNIKLFIVRYCGFDGFDDGHMILRRMKHYSSRDSFTNLPRFENCCFMDNATLSLNRSILIKYDIYELENEEAMFLMIEEL